MKRYLFLLATAMLPFAGFSQNNQAGHPGANKHNSRHFYAPTGRTIATDSIYLNWVGPLLDVNFGITDKFTAGIGTPMFTGVYATASYGDQIAPNLTARFGNLTGFPVIGGGFYSLPYGVITVGQAHSEFTAGAGYFYMSDGLLQELFDENADELNPNSPVFNVGGYHQLNSRLGFAFEGWYLPQSDWLVVMPGIRFYTKRDRRYWNVGFIKLVQPYLESVLVDDGNGNFYYQDTRRIRNLTLPMLSFATYL